MDNLKLKTSLSENSAERVPAEVYTKEYYLSENSGWQQYIESGGMALGRNKKIFDALMLQHDHKLLDIGCGRGEIILNAVSKGSMAVGLDYSEAAVALARQSLNLSQKYEMSGQGLVMQGNCKQLPFKTDMFDRILMADIVEHLYPHELAQCLVEVYRILKPGGTLLIHTTPNSWFANFGYGLTSFIYQFFIFSPSGLKKFLYNRESWVLPRNDYHRVMHINEMSPWQLRRALVSSGFRPRVFFLSLRDDGSRWKKWLRRLIHTRMPFCLILNSEIYAYGWK